MIQLEFENIETLWEVLADKLAGVEQLITPQTRTQIAKAVFTITSKRFLLDFSKAAHMSPKKYFHMFEWEETGNLGKKLFIIRREKVLYGALDISIGYKKSNKPVPIPKELLSRGSTGKSVQKRSIFANMAQVMESGNPVSFTTKQYIAFLSNKDNKVVFVAPGTFVKIQNPGGKQTAGSFERFVEKWYLTKVESSVKQSGLFRNLEKSVALAMNESKISVNNVRQTIRKVTEQYAQGVVEL
jgi:hypothetical protein